jgi:ribosomal protein S18 acetylase RimI-like enzyme
VEAWRETYVGIVPVQVLAGLSVDRRKEVWRRILTNPTAFSSSAVFVAERDGTVVGFSCCGMQRDESLNAQEYDGEISSIYVLRAFQRLGLGVALMSVMGGELQRRRLQAASLWVPSRERERSPIL